MTYLVQLRGARFTPSVEPARQAGLFAIPHVDHSLPAGAVVRCHAARVPRSILARVDVRRVLPVIASNLSGYTEV